MALTGDYPQGMSLDDALDEIDRLARDNEQLRSDLEDCKDRLIELLQKENDIPEKTIKDALLSIFKSIDSWIDDISGDEKFDFKSQWIKNLQSPNRRENLSVLGLESRCLELEWQVKLGKLETCHYVILSLVISRSLCKDIFRLKEAERWGSVYPLGLEESEVDWLVEIQKSLASEDLGRGMFPFASLPLILILTIQKPPRSDTNRQMEKRGNTWSHRHGWISACFRKTVERNIQRA